MLPRKYKLKKENDFKRVFEEGRYYPGGFIGFKLTPNDLEYNRIGIIIGNKISKKAVVRNKIKRRIEESIRISSDNLKQGFDIVIMVRPEIAEKDYSVIEERLKELFQKAGLKTN